MRILIASQDWDYRFARPQQLALIFSERHDIIYLATGPGIRTRFRDARRGWVPWRLPGYRPGTRIQAISALYLHDAGTADALIRNHEQYAARLRVFRAKALQGIDLAIVTNPIDLELVRRLDWHRLAYDCLDRYEDFYPEGSDLRALLLAREQELLQRADFVFASARVLVEDKSRVRPVHYLPHGVDAERFELGARSPAPDLRRARHPIVGFVGAIEGWLNLDWVRAAASELPDVSFVMVGDIRCDLRGLDQLPNVRFCGGKRYGAVPSYVAAFDVGIIPFEISHLTAAVNPVKALEYFALGKPVVSSQMSELEQYLPYISLVRTQADFISAIRTSLSADRPDGPEARRRIARSRSWRAVAEGFLAVVEGRAAGTGF